MTALAMTVEEVAPPCRRGTSNGNARGSAEGRRRRRAWLLDTYAADVRARVYRIAGQIVTVNPVDRAGVDLDRIPPHFDTATIEAACRCYRCGTVLVDGTLTVDRIIPGCRGGTYRRTNIRPACAGCNSETGGRTRGKR